MDVRPLITNLLNPIINTISINDDGSLTRVSLDPPIFVGPMVLHGDSKFATFHHFFSAINTALNGTQLASNEFLCEL